jgi:hypothetical protein
LVQDSGLINLKKSKELRNSKVRSFYFNQLFSFNFCFYLKISLKIDEQDLINRLQDEALLADILTNKIYK